MIKRFIEIFSRNLDKMLEERTSWGRNDLKLRIQEVISRSLSEMIE